MAIIGLYDIDMLHRGRSAPNLELMQVYNYYNSRNNRVIMMKSNDGLTKYQQIFYFKEKPNIAIPNSLNLNLDKGQLIGYGFFGRLPQLKEEIKSLPPDFEPYDIYSHKLTIPRGYDALKRDSLIRLETEDFSGFKKDRHYIYLSDVNFLYTPGAEEFVQDNKDRDFIFYNPLTVNDEETYNKFYRYTTLFNRRLIINFDFNEDFFYENIGEAYFHFTKKENESELNYLIRLVKAILIYKKKDIIFLENRISQDTLENKILDWGKSRTQYSFAKYYENNNMVQNIIRKQPTELRLLLKQNPLTITRSIDFQSNL